MINPLIARFAHEHTALVDPTQAARVEACLTAAASHPRFEELASVADSEDFWGESGGWCRPYVVQDGVLQIPIRGVLVNNFPYQFYEWATGYEYIWEAFKRGCGDFATGSIRGIALVCDTPGGMVAGCFDTRDKMIALKEQLGVPVAGFAHESAYSAGYAMITVADKGQITVSRTGGVGSIGVVTSHLDMSGRMEQMGLKLTYIASDPSKVEGNPYEPLSEDAFARIKSRIDELYSIFLSAVMDSRGLTEEQLRGELKAYCFTASQAVSNGLADKIGTLEDATAEFIGYLDDPSEREGEEDMSTKDTSAVDQAAIDKAVADAVAAEQAKAADAAAAAVAADRKRQQDITGHAEAKGRESLASHFALNTNMSVEDAVAALAASPKAAEPVSTENADAPANFSAAMESTGNPNVGADSNGDGDKEETARANGDDILAMIGAVGLAGFSVPKN